MGGVKRIHKAYARKQLSINSDLKIVLYVGQIIFKKGIDVLLAAARYLPPDYRIYLIGRIPDQHYLEVVKSYGLDNALFLNFMNKEQLKSYYQAADVFVLPTREDIWGLVINEALTYGLPTVSTRGCVSAGEMLPEKCIVPVEDDTQLSSTILSAADMNNGSWQEYALKKTMEYSIENSAVKHIEIIQNMYVEEN